MESQYQCENCKSDIKESDSFCSNCGSIFEEKKCSNHSENEAEGVCVICSEALCNSCLGRVDDICLCVDHSDYEIYEGMARVYGSSDFPEIKYIEDCLQKEGIKTFIYSRKATNISLGGTDYSLFRPSGDFNGHLINEEKIMVPFDQVLKAKEIINNLEIEEQD